jgi:replicative DNA helicase
MSASEQNVLGAVLLDPSAYWRVADLLTADHFTIDGHAAIWKAFGTLNDAGRPIDAFTVMEATNWADNDPYIFKLASDTPSAANVRAYAESVRLSATTRRVRLAGERIAAQGDLTEAQSLIASISDDQPGRLVTAKEAAGAMWKGVMARWEAKEEMSGLLTGIPQLDAMTGGLQPGRVYALGARAKMGKSILAWQIAAHVAVNLGQRVAGFSLEMSMDELMQRMACALAGVRSVGLLRPKAMEDHEWSQLSVAMADLKASPLLLSERMDLTIEQIEAHARQAKPALVVIDYLQLIEQPRLENEAARLGFLTRRIKKLAKECDVPVIEVFQVNRGNEAGAIRPPRPSDARGSGTIEQDCDAMFLLHRPNYYDKTESPGLRLDVALQRNGPTGLIRMEDDLERCRFLPSDREWSEPRPSSKRDDDL